MIDRKNQQTCGMHKKSKQSPEKQSWALLQLQQAKPTFFKDTAIVLEQAQTAAVMLKPPST